MTATVATATDTQCPAYPWCTVDHTLSHEDNDYHYSNAIDAGPVALRIDQDTHGRTTLEIVTSHADGDGLTLDDLDVLQARLADLRPILAAATLPAGTR